MFSLQCMGWTWYQANDMQFYIIAPAILFTAYRYREGGRGWKSEKGTHGGDLQYEKLKDVRLLA